jgi:hypothetical protein
MGAKVTSIVQLSVGAREAGHRFLGEDSFESLPRDRDVAYVSSRFPNVGQLNSRGHAAVDRHAAKAQRFHVELSDWINNIGSQADLLRVAGSIIHDVQSSGLSVPTESDSRSTARVQLLPGFCGAPVQYRKRCIGCGVGAAQCNTVSGEDNLGRASVRNRRRQLMFGVQNRPCLNPGLRGMWK